VPDVRHHTVQVPATSANLGPGFDAFGLALSRYLAVASVPRDAQTERVVTTGEGAGELSTGDDNLLWRAVVAFCEAHDVPVPDVALRAANELPLERGLGSSSSAIVAGLVLGRALTSVAVGDPALVVLADELEGHPDNVAPALLGGLVACTRDDEGQLVIRRRNPAPHLRPVAFVPSSRQATTAARAVLPEELSCADAVTQASRAGHVLAGLTGAWPVDPTVAGDLLHEPPRLQAMAPTGALVAELRGRGIHAWLSGAGPTVAALVGAVDDDVVGELRHLAAAHGFASLELAVDLGGALACPEDGCAISGVRTRTGTRATGGVPPGGRGCVQCPRQRV
jgi:homoserine kinase